MPHGSPVPAAMSGASSEEEDVATSSAVRRNPVAADARRLLAEFSYKRSVRYEDFKSSWTKLQFWFVYCAGTDHSRREEIVTCLAVEGLKYLTSDRRPHHERLAGLYLIYTTFSTQPMSPRVPIRVTVENWMALVQLQAVIREEKYAEADYILHHMKTEKAFILTYTSQQKCMSTASGDQTSEHLYRTFLTGSHSLHPDFLSSLSQEVEQSVADYHEAKDQRRVFFPQHLLNPPQLPQQLSKVVADYDAAVTEKLSRFRET